MMLFGANDIIGLVVRSFAVFTLLDAGRMDVFRRYYLRRYRYQDASVHVCCSH